MLILIAVEERKLRVEVGLGLEGALPDGKTGRIMDEYMTPSLRQNDYSTGMLEGYKAVASQIYQEYGIEGPRAFWLRGFQQPKYWKQTGYSHCVNLDFTDCTCDPSADPAARFPRARISVLLVLRRAARATRRRRKRHLRRRFFRRNRRGRIWRRRRFFPAGVAASAGAAAPEDFKSALKKRNMGCCKAFCNSPCFFSYSRCTSGGQSSIPSKMLSS